MPLKSMPYLAYRQLGALEVPVVATGIQRTEIEAFIHARFAHAYGADVRHYLPHLRAVRDAAGQIRAAFGMRAAATTPLFLENYLDAPIETVLAARAQQPVARTQLLEIGNLACVGAGGARALIVMLAAELAAQDYTWVVCTIAPVLYNAFRRLGLELLDLGPAEPDCLDACERARWGSYYAQRPHVMAGRIADAADLLARLQSAPAGDAQGVAA